MSVRTTSVVRPPPAIRLLRWVMLGMGLLIIAATSIACSGDDPAPSGAAAEVNYADDVPAPPAAGDAEVPCVSGGDPSETGQGSAAQPGVSADQGGSPFTVPGARQVPGPNTTVTAVPSAPVSVVVAPPPNPDTPAAASITDGPGAPAPTYDLSGDQPSTPSTETPPPAPAPGATLPSASGSSCSGGL